MPQQVLHRGALCWCRWGRGTGGAVWRLHVTRGPLGGLGDSLSIESPTQCTANMDGGAGWLVAGIWRGDSCGGPACWEGDWPQGHQATVQCPYCALYTVVMCHAIPCCAVPVGNRSTQQCSVPSTAVLCSTVDS